MTAQLPADNIEFPEGCDTMPIAELRRHPKNARTHSLDQIKTLAAIMLETGFNDPIGVNALGVILEGHGRLEAAEHLGLTEVPVVRLTHMSDEQERAYMLAHNRIAMSAGWDETVLRDELAALDKSSAVDMTALGFGDDEIVALLQGLDVTIGAGTLNPPPAPPAAPPPPPRSTSSQLPSGVSFRVVITCADEAHQTALLSRFAAEGLTCQALMS